MVFAVVQHHRATKADRDTSVDFCSVVEGKGIGTSCARDILYNNSDGNVRLCFGQGREQVGQRRSSEFGVLAKGVPSCGHNDRRADAHGKTDANIVFFQDLVDHRDVIGREAEDREIHVLAHGGEIHRVLGQQGINGNIAPTACGQIQGCDIIQDQRNAKELGTEIVSVATRATCEHMHTGCDGIRIVPDADIVRTAGDPG